MKKLAAIFMMLLLMSSPAAALDWSNPQVDSPYSVGIIPVREVTTIFGGQTIQPYNGTTQAGDGIAFIVRVDVPENPRPALLQLKGEHASIHGALTASVPSTPGTWYFEPDGTWSRKMTYRTAYCTGVPTITARITGKEKVDSVGAYSVTRDSSGFILSNNGRGMLFCPDGSGRVYSAFVFGLDYKTRLTAALLAEDGEPAAVARAVLRALKMDSAALLGGNVYMTEKLLAANFGVAIDTEASKTWGYVIPEKPPDVSPVVGVPATGGASELLMCALILIQAALIVYDRNHRRRL